MKERRVVANVVEVLGVTGKYTTDDLAEWEVHPERLAEVLRTHSSCIPLATSGWNETVPLPTTWAIWCISRMTHAKCQLNLASCGGG
jgi:hypothetical protein